MYRLEELYLFSYASTQKNISASFVQKLFQNSLREKTNIFQLKNREREAFFERSLGTESKHVQTLFNLWEEMEEFSYLTKVEKDILEAKDRGIQILSYGEEEYPNSLYSLKSPPYLLFLLGKLPSKAALERSLAIVGSRNMSSRGKEFARFLAKKAKEESYYSISGLARGIDAEVHQNSLGKTGAVLAHGLDRTIYPKEHSQLAEEILKEGGFLVSEIPLGIGVEREFFIRRNRIQAALAKSLCVVETGVKGGSVHTFHFAKSLGKNIYVPDFNQEFLEKYQEKVKIVSSPEEILEIESSIAIQKKLF